MNITMRLLTLTLTMIYLRLRGKISWIGADLTAFATAVMVAESVYIRILQEMRFLYIGYFAKYGCLRHDGQ